MLEGNAGRWGNPCGVSGEGGYGLKKRQKPAFFQTAEGLFGAKSQSNLKSFWSNTQLQKH